MLDWVDVCTAAGVERRAPDQLGFSYRRSNLRPGQVVSLASFELSESEPEAVKATLAEMRAKRREAQPSGIKTFGSTFKNPDVERAEGRTAGQLLEAAGCRGLHGRGRARCRRKHANFVENAGEATTADVLAVMAAGRRASTTASGSCSSPRSRCSARSSGPPTGSWNPGAEGRSRRSRGE